MRVYATAWSTTPPSTTTRRGGAAAVVPVRAMYVSVSQARRQQLGGVAKATYICIELVGSKQSSKRWLPVRRAATCKFAFCFAALASKKLL
ncbi:hypothetical protein GUJ93_ZPchr0005g15882 [Zizania palustris]|uniref:Uncharacterized protein n=1 Tax=Zizania palustris TaxID=103762 RepID=A0A8J5SV72_ZIZPA|nr:hypothetical protein GUJ93_ZPchr0005g15882 [Zizania palustris]